jgi:hypothetical protein
VSSAVDPGVIADLEASLKKLETVVETFNALTKFSWCYQAKPEWKFEIRGDSGTLCCEETRSVGDGKRVSGSAAFQTEGACFIGLSNYLPFAPVEYVQALGLNFGFTAGIQGTLATTVVGGGFCSSEESVGLRMKGSASAQIVKVGDVIDASFTGFSLEAASQLKSSNFFSNVEFDNSFCVDGRGELAVKILGIQLVVYPIELFPRVCF